MDHVQAFRQLGLPADASLKEVRRAYRTLVRSWHPDRFPDNAETRRKAQEKLKDINAAYQVARKHAAVRPLEPAEPDSPFRFRAPAASSPPAESVWNTSQPTVGKPSCDEPCHQLPSVVPIDRPVWLNILLLIMGIFCAGVASNKYGASVRGLLYWMQVMIIPFICSLVCNSSLGRSSRTRAGYLAAILLMGGVAAVDLLATRGSGTSDPSFTANDEAEYASGGRIGGSGAAGTAGFTLEPGRSVFGGKPADPAPPVSPAAPVAPAPAVPIAPLAPIAK